MRSVLFARKNAAIKQLIFVVNLGLFRANAFLGASHLPIMASHYLISDEKRTIDKETKKQEIAVSGESSLAQRSR